MVRNEQANWCPAAHILASSESSEILAVGLRRIKQMCHYSWNLRYILTDDSAAEQKAVKLAFHGLIDGENEVSHLLCRVHSERTLDRNLKGKEYEVCNIIGQY